MTILRGTILSHTAMNGTGFCTNIAVWDPQTGVWMQVRPRLPPNRPLDLTSFGQSAASMRQYWQPGALVDIDLLGAPAQSDRRVTHPEDCLFNGKATVLYATREPPAQFRQTAQRFQAASLKALFPPIQGRRGGKRYVEDGHALTQSVGYVLCSTVTLVSSTEADVLTHAGESFKVAVKDAVFLARPLGSSATNVLVRFSLANAWDGGHIGFSPERCCLMLSHVVP